MTTAQKFNELREIIRCHESHFDGSYALDIIDDLERAAVAHHCANCNQYPDGNDLKCGRCGRLVQLAHFYTPDRRPDDAR